MNVIVYGDFNCPFSYLASQRADRLLRSGIAVDWRAVEHDRQLPATGLRSAASPVDWAREIAEVTALALAAEHAPAGPPAVVSNSMAATAAYAEAVGDGVADQLRRAVFRAIWLEGANLSSGYEVRRLVTAAMWPPEDFTDRLASPDIPSRLIQDADLARITRRSGGTVQADGGPLSTDGWERIRLWRQDWLALPGPIVPTVVGPDMVARPGLDGLRYLAELAGAGNARAHLAAAA
ncbi:MAG: DsbA family protein [Streptosporangiaceae bacterium]